ncbi:MAG: hypothetical protein ACRCZD_06000 [Phycicoccus sp.]
MRYPRGLGTLERRLHVLLDEHRYERLASEARESGRSVAAVIRTAIDEHFDAEARDRARRAAAGRRLLASVDPHETHAPDWPEIKASFETEMSRRAP